MERQLPSLTEGDKDDLLHAADILDLLTPDDLLDLMVLDEGEFRPLLAG